MLFDNIVLQESAPPEKTTNFHVLVSCCFINKCLNIIHDKDELKKDVQAKLHFLVLEVHQYKKIHVNPSLYIWFMNKMFTLIPFFA